MTISFKSVGKTVDDLLSEQLAAVRTPIGPITPLRLSSSGVDAFAMNYSIADNIHDNLRNLLLTNRGERLALTDYGANLLPLASEYADAEAFDAEVVQRIKTAVAKWMPFIDLDTYSSEFRAGAVFLSISYNVLAIGVTDRKLQIELRVT